MAGYRKNINKYRNIKTSVNGITFDSKKEAGRYTELLLLKGQGAIKDLELQPSFDLIVNDKKIATYKADFKYFDVGRYEWVIEDVKSPITKTPVYRLKKKILENQVNPVIITEI